MSAEPAKSVYICTLCGELIYDATGIEEHLTEYHKIYCIELRAALAEEIKRGKRTCFL